MKKFWALSMLTVVLLLAGCNWWNKVDITDNNIDVESCNKYFETIDCILDNDNDREYTNEMRNQLREDVKAMQNEWEKLDEESLDETCTTELNKFIKIKDSLTEIGCNLD